MWCRLDAAGSLLAPRDAEVAVSDVYFIIETKDMAAIRVLYISVAEET